MDLSVCGIDCAVMSIECNNSCEELIKKPCRGCNAEGGRLFWTKYLGLETCPIYNCCVNIKQFDHCGQCVELPCEIYFNTKDPSMSDEVFNQAIQKRVDVLRQL